MKALVSRAYGPLEELTIDELPALAPAPGQVLVRVEAASLNSADAKIAIGAMKDLLPVSHPFVPGADAAGRVASVGTGVSAYGVGDPVVVRTGAAFGALAEYVVVPDGPAIARRPDGLDAVHAAALPTGALTAATMIDAARVRPGESVLVVGASGGVGTFAVQLAHQAGARVLATGRAGEAARLRELGADAVIEYQSTDTAAAAHRLVPGGVDVVIDVATAGPALAGSAAAARPGGRLVSALGGPERFDREVTATYIQTQVPGGRLAQLAQAAAEGRLQVEVSATYPFADAGQALVDFAGRHVFGKVAVSF
jgi:NADPH:quinone reductase-like Zn-dependent oxidoreductase